MQSFVVGQNRQDLVVLKNEHCIFLYLSPNFKVDDKRYLLRNGKNDSLNFYAHFLLSFKPLMKYFDLYCTSLIVFGFHFVVLMLA